jgi:hypothetical protein
MELSWADQSSLGKRRAWGRPSWLLATAAQFSQPPVHPINRRTTPSRGPPNPPEACHRQFAKGLRADWPGEESAPLQLRKRPSSPHPVANPVSQANSTSSASCCLADHFALPAHTFLEWPPTPTRPQFSAHGASCQASARSVPPPPPPPRRSTHTHTHTHPLPLPSRSRAFLIPVPCSLIPGRSAHPL